MLAQVAIDEQSRAFAENTPGLGGSAPEAFPHFLREGPT